MNRTCKWMVAAALAAAGLSEQIAEAAAPATPQQMITGRAYLGITGTSVANLTNSVKFPNNPDAVHFLPYFEWNATGDIFTAAPNYADNYGGQIAGYFYPPSTGDYIFYIAADDNASLFLSPSSDPSDKRLIARESAWSNAREFFSSGGNSDLTAKDSSQFTASEWPNKDAATGIATIRLQAGQPYYIEAIFKDGTGGDRLAVGVADPLGAIDFNNPIPGEYLSTDRTIGAVSITTQPASQTIDERGSVTFSVIADGTPPYSYQWRRNGENITDATNLNLTIPSVAVADNSAKFSVVVTGANGSVTSQDATLTVTPDTAVPTLVNAKANPGGTGVTLTFSEAVDPVSAAVTSNYQLSSAAGPLNVTEAVVSPSGTTVTLTTAQQTLGTKYTALVSNIKDTAATPNTIAANSKAVFFPTGAVKEVNGMIVVEAENFDRNLDNLWVRDTTRGVPSGGASMVNPNGAGGSEGATKLEYDVEFASAGTYYVWIRASGDNGNDDSVWFHLDGERPVERATGNQASMTGFQPQADFVWRSDAQDPPDPFTVEIPSPGIHTIALARREDGSFVDKILLTTDSTFTPTGLGPIETRQGAPGAPTATLTGVTANQTFNAGANVNLGATVAGQSGLDIVRVDYTANGSVIATSSTAPFGGTWSNAQPGIYELRAVAVDELGQTTASAPINVTVASQSGATIAWVSFHPDSDTPSAAAATAGFERAPDAAYTDLLESWGHTVTRVRTTGAPNTALLNQFDLVIISRSVPSGDYETAAETAAWNGITAPMMLLGGYANRANRLGLHIGSGIPDTAGAIKLNVLEPTHAIFEGVQVQNGVTVNDYTTNLVNLFNGTAQRGISVVTDPIAGGTVLATVATETDPALNGTIIAEIPAGTVLANATADTLAGKRLIFLTGSREHNGLTSEGAGIWDLSEDGEKMFLNAVEYMSGKEGTEPADTPTISIARTATGATITFEGTLQSADTLSGPWANVAGATSPHTVTIGAGDTMKFYRTTR